LVTGQVSDGNPLADVEILIIDAKGKKIFTHTDSEGAFWFSYTGKQFPLTMVASAPEGRQSTLVAVLAQAPQDETVPLRANINTLTSAQAALLTPSGNPLDLAEPTVMSGLVTSSALTQASATLNAMLANILQLEGVDAASFDPVHMPDTEDHAGLDAILSDVIVSGSAKLSLASIAEPDHAIALQLQTAVPDAPLVAPRIRARYLNEVAAAFQTYLPIASALTPLPTASPATSAVARFERPLTDHFGLSGDGSISATVRVPYRIANSPYRQVAATAVWLGEQANGRNWVIREDAIVSNDAFDAPTPNSRAAR
jgi:hypothetical protein